MNPFMILAATLGLGSALSAMLLLRIVQREERRLARIRSVQLRKETDSALRPATRGMAPVRIVAAAGLWVARSGLLSSKTVVQLEQTLQSAGFRGGAGLGLFVGSKMLLLIGLPVFAWLGLGYLDVSNILRNGGTACAAVIGLLSPDYFVRTIRARFLKRLDAGLPDALDMMVICSEAGLGLEPAITRVAAEIVHSNVAVAEELQHTSRELRMMSDRRIALTNMGDRTGLETLKRLGGTLVQTMQYGTPLANALRSLSSEMRQEMLTRFEERAARLPVLLTLPMIIFILPTIFLIVGGPAAIKVMSVMKH